MVRTVHQCLVPGVGYREGAVTSFGPLLPLNIRLAGEFWRGKGASGQAASLHWGGLRFAQTSLRCSVSWPRRRTHFAHCVRCVRTSATSQLTTRASREATSPALLGAPEALRVLPERAFAEALVLPAAGTPIAAARQAEPPESGRRRTAATGRLAPFARQRFNFGSGAVRPESILPGALPGSLALGRRAIDMTLATRRS